MPGQKCAGSQQCIVCGQHGSGGFDAVIPLDETIAAAKAVAERMPREHRRTALGGLAVTPTSLAIQKRLKVVATAVVDQAQPYFRYGAAVFGQRFRRSSCVVGGQLRG